MSYNILNVRSYWPKVRKSVLFKKNRLTMLTVDSDAGVFSRRTGVRRSGTFSLSYDGAGRLTADGSRGLTSVSYDSNGHPHFFLTDWQGNVIGVHDKEGKIEQRVDFYPSGEPWLEPEYTKAGNGNRRLFGAKERITEAGLNEYDFGARNYVASFPRFTSIDPLAAKYPWLSPYVYCATDPINLIDPDGKEWRISSHRGEEKKLHIRIDFSGVVYDYSNIEKNEKLLATAIQNQIEDVFTFDGGHFDVTTHADIRVAQDKAQIKETDHVFAIVHDHLIGSADDHFLAMSDTNGLLIRIGASVANYTKTGRNRRSIAHEIGHTGGLFDNDPRILNKESNLMTQIVNLQQGTKNQAINIEAWQLNEIIRNYNQGKLNLWSPIKKRRVNLIRYKTSFEL